MIGHTYACHMVNTYGERNAVTTCLFDYLTDTVWTDEPIEHGFFPLVETATHVIDDAISL